MDAAIFNFDAILIFFKKLFYLQIRLKSQNVNPKFYRNRLKNGLLRANYCFGRHLEYYRHFEFFKMSS